MMGTSSSSVFGNDELFRSDVNFISKTLARAQISCSSLLLGLWYIDRFCRQQRRRQHASAFSSSLSSYSSGSFIPSPPSVSSSPFSRKSTAARCPTLHARNLFVAAIVVADKFLADVTWSNADWAKNTYYMYSLDDINRLEREFLHILNFRLYIHESEYHHFTDYLAFRLHLRQIHGSLLSYRSMNVLSQSLIPIYADRLHLTLRPIEAMFLLTKTLTSICLAYVTVVAAAYMMYNCIQLVHACVAEMVRTNLLAHYLQAQEAYSVLLIPER
ncbi:hypothetical protein BCR43DRAFT_485350 [Syncephalastrum racemosum]|uniref:Cyclin N-terminal domain-containing protein n=1 Tax=Syncephalastrum racemosum TaxID=13706 RepID=A0A1X2HM87_SYNRA|nr:hypothetical protein BCR43DRAFT_485350 [Syncephalastrum racemosum]